MFRQLALYRSSDLEAVFEEFRQVDKGDRKAEGNGLGLALCRTLVALHRGSIWLKSAPGQDYSGG